LTLAQILLIALTNFIDFSAENQTSILRSHDATSKSQERD